MFESARRKRRLWPLLIGCSVAGVLLGAFAVLTAPVWFRGRGVQPPLAAPARQVGGRARSDGPQVTGDLYTTIKHFKLEDPEGHTVLEVDEINGFLDLDAIGNSEFIRMPRGQVSGVKLLLRRGPSGRVSLSEAFRGNSEPHEPNLKRGGTPLQIGPLKVKDVTMTVAMGKMPVIIHLDRATVRVQRKLSDLAPRIFLTDVHGRMVSPDPLPQTIAIEGAEGVVDLASDPLIDIRTRVCIGDSEMRMRLQMPERREPVHMTVDAEGPLATSALIALNLVSVVKSDKFTVHSGRVSVEEAFVCGRAQAAAPP